VQALEPLAQTGVAGVMALLWFLERRHSSQRERELSAAHEEIMRSRTALGELIAVVKDNSVAMTALERSQSRLVMVCERIAEELRRRDGAAGRPTRAG